MRRILVLLGLITATGTLGAFGASCGDPVTPPAPGSHCTADTHCAPGNSCSYGVCRTPCPCSADAACIDGFCYSRACAGEAPCPDGSVCLGAACGDPLCGGNLCSPLVCDPDRGECVACLGDDACEAPLTCDLATGQCVCPGGDTETVCDDDADDDCDGLTDCEDSDCATAMACSCDPQSDTETVCDDGADDDCDGLIDCGDSDCEGATCGESGAVCAGGQCGCPGGDVETACVNGDDDDCDGDIDCADSDCDGATCGPFGVACREGACVCPGGSTETDCENGQDDDCDGYVDCADSDCVADTACTCSPTEQTETHCGDGIDSDCDRDVDCADSDCAGAVCAGVICDPWGECGGFADVCGESGGSQSRSCIDYACAQGICQPTTTNETQSCTRDTDGTSCASPVYGEWSACGGFGSACDETGTQTRTVTEATCVGGTCRTLGRLESRSCTRITDGATCDTTLTGPWSPCGGFSDTCDETGTRTRENTIFTCSSGACAGALITESDSCLRLTEGLTCALPLYGDWGTCQFSDACDETGTQSRTVTTQTCASGGCASSTATDLRSCSRVTQGDSCGTYSVCNAGTCVDCQSNCIIACEGVPCGPFPCVCDHRMCLDPVGMSLCR